MKRRKPRGISLTEILVAIGIVAILAAILFPLAKTMQAYSLRAKCASNLRGLGGGLFAYAGEHTGQLIPAYQGSFGYWFNELAPYMGGGTLDWAKDVYPAWLQCPSKPGKCGYGWNYFHFGQNTYSATNAAYSRTAQITKPSNTIIIGDSADDPEAPKVEHFVIYGTLKKLAKRHAGGTANYLFLDGHVASMTPEQVNEELPRIFEKYEGQKNDLLQMKNP